MKWIASGVFGLGQFGLKNICWSRSNWQFLNWKPRQHLFELNIINPIYIDLHYPWVCLVCHSMILVTWYRLILIISNICCSGCMCKEETDVWLVQGVQRTKVLLWSLLVVMQYGLVCRDLECVINGGMVDKMEAINSSYPLSD